MTRATALLGSALFLVIAPGTIAGLVPWWISGWRVQPPLLGMPVICALGVVLIAGGLAVLVDSFARFALTGLGTPAPIAPPRNLVVSGLYRYGRNPMYMAILSLIVGQGLLFGSPALLWYGAAVWPAFHLFVLLYEEPTLRSTFGVQYAAYCENVPRWIPRVHPWKGISQIGRGQ